MYQEQRTMCDVAKPNPLERWRTPKSTPLYSYHLCGHRKSITYAKKVKGVSDKRGERDGTT